MSIFSKLWKKLFGKKKATTYLEKLKAESKTMLGHHDDTLVGYNWLSPIGKSDIYDVIGSYPAVIEFDLMGIELGRTNYTDEIKYSDIRDEAIKQHKRGGYICFSWHMYNPYNGNGVTSLNKNTVPYILDSTTITSTKFWDGIDRAIEFLKTIVDADGNQIPFMFRPFHECLNNSTMWWVADQCTDEQYIELWKQVHDKFKEELGDKVLFIYSPSSYVKSREHYLSRYAGDEYVDILGIEEYQPFDTIEKSRTLLLEKINYNLNATKKIADSLGKPYALTESGIYINFDANVWTECYSKILDYKPLFMCIWRNANKDKAGLCYAPYPEEKSEKDFAEFCKDLKTI